MYYEAKIEESEKAGSHWEWNQRHLWLELPVLDNHQLSQSPICTVIYQLQVWSTVQEFV